MSIKDFMLCEFYLIKNIRIDELSLYLWRSFNRHDCFVSFHITWDGNIKLNNPLIDEVEGQAYLVPIPDKGESVQKGTEAREKNHDRNIPPGNTGYKGRRK